MTQMNVDPAILQHLTDRTVMPKDQFLLLTDEGRLRAFTIAKQTDAGVLQDTLDALQETTANGGTLWDFKQDFPELLAPYREAGREWHLELVFRQNTAQAQAVGAYRARQQNKQFLPYVEYQAGVNPRPSHAALDGRIFEVDDPFLLAHTPPWDFNCNCDLISRTRQQVGAVIKEEADLPAAERRVVPGNPALQSMMERNQMPSAESGIVHPVDVRTPTQAGGEYSFRPDRLNQPVDLSGYDPEVRARLSEALESVGYTESADGMTMEPPDAAAFKVQNAEVGIQNSKVGRPIALKIGLPLSFGRPEAARPVGRATGRVGRPGPQITPHARIGRREAA